MTSSHSVKKGTIYRKYRHIAHFVEWSYLTLRGRVWLLVVPGGHSWPTYSEKQAGYCRYVTPSYLGYQGPRTMLTPQKRYPQRGTWDLRVGFLAPGHIWVPYSAQWPPRPMLLQRVLTRPHSPSLSRELPPVQTRRSRTFDREFPEVG